MTELASAPGERATDTDGSGIAPIHHWIGGARSRAPRAARARSSTRRRAGRAAPSTSRRSRRSTRRSQAAKQAFASWRTVSLAQARGADVQHPRARARAQAGDREAARRRARQGALGRDGRGDARPRGDRVRLRDPDAAEGRVLGAGLDGRRRLLDPPAGRRRGGDHAVQLPGDGARCGCGRRRSPAATRSC